MAILPSLRLIAAGDGLKSVERRIGVSVLITVTTSAASAIGRRHLQQHQRERATGHPTLSWGKALEGTSGGRLRPPQNNTREMDGNDNRRRWGDGNARKSRRRKRREIVSRVQAHGRSLACGPSEHAPGAKTNRGLLVRRPAVSALASVPPIRVASVVSSVSLRASWGTNPARNASAIFLTAIPPPEDHGLSTAGLDGQDYAFLPSPTSLPRRTVAPASQRTAPAVPKASFPLHTTAAATPHPFGRIISLAIPGGPGGEPEKGSTLDQWNIQLCEFIPFCAIECTVSLPR